MEQLQQTTVILTFLREASAEDIQEVLSRLRQEDLRECLDLTGLPNKGALEASLLAASHDNTNRIFAGGLFNGPPEVLFGVDCISPTEFPKTGIIWLIGTDAISKYPIKFHKAGLSALNAFEQQFDLLTNFADTRNKLHLRWIARLGFTFFRDAPLGPKSIPYREFAKICA